MSRMLLIAAALVTSGCFVPPPLELEADGGGSSAPMLLAGGTIPTVGQPITIERQASDPTTFNLALDDRDSWTLFLRFFVDGSPYKEFIANTTATSCTSTCAKVVKIAGLCDTFNLGSHFIEVVVADQEWDDGANTNDLRRTVAGGFTTSVSWRFNCIESLKTDAGL